MLLQFQARLYVQVRKKVFVISKVRADSTITKILAGETTFQMLCFL